MEVKRSPLTRRVAVKRASPLRHRSKKRAAKERAAADFRSAYLAEHPSCEFRVPDVCTGRAVDVHERTRRGQGGALDEAPNLAAICRACHDHAHANPAESYERGWLVRRWSNG